MATIHLAVSILLFAVGAWLLIASTVGTGGLAPGLDRCFPDNCNEEYTAGLTVKLLIGIGLISGGVVVAKAASKPTQEKLEEKLEEQDYWADDWMSDDTHETLKEYERDYLARQGIKSTNRKSATKPKPAETRESESNFCDNCGKSLRPTAKFCSGCGSPRS